MHSRRSSFCSLRAGAAALLLAAAALPACDPDVALVDDEAIAAHEQALGPIRLATVTVTSASGLVSTLASDFTGTIWIPATAIINLTGQRNLEVKSGVHIVGERSGMQRGPMVYTDDDATGYSLFSIRGSGTSIEGLRLRGPAADRRSTLPGIIGIRVHVDPGTGAGKNILVRNNEISQWVRAGVEVTGTIGDETTEQQVPAGTPVIDWQDAADVNIARNFFHDNLGPTTGYGVAISHGAYAQIYGNTFDYNRHAVSGDGSPYSGYRAFYNYVLQGGFTYGSDDYQQHFDMHGVGAGGYGGMAGHFIEIGHNTIRGAQEYNAGLKVRPAFELRGKTVYGAFFHDNFMVHDGADEAVSLKYDGDTGWSETESDFNYHSLDNHYQVASWNDLGVGDFDADGRDDLLVTTGSAWFCSSAGQSEWRFLNASETRIADLHIGSFDDQPGADVFTVNNGTWLFSSGGTGAWQTLRGGPPSDADLLFGDFDGDGRTDVFYTTNGKWYVSHSARDGFVQVNVSGITAADLRVGDFNGDGKADIFAIANGNWSWSSGGTGAWQKLNDKLSASVAGLRFGDFNGDGRTDIVKDAGTQWQYSVSGAGPWLLLHDDGVQAAYGDLAQVQLGDFNGSGDTDAIRFGVANSHPDPILVGWFGGATTPFGPRSLHPMY